MDYEKKYKEALERAREVLNNEDVERGIMEYLFPELKESEDERIRKGLIKYFKNFETESLYIVGINEDEILAWLEKQGEKKSQRMVSAEAKEALYGEELNSQKTGL